MNHDLLRGFCETLWVHWGRCQPATSRRCERFTRFGCCIDDVVRGEEVWMVSES